MNDLISTYPLIVYLYIANLDSDSLVKLHAYLMIHLLNSSRDDASLFEIVCKTKHRESLAGSSLTVAHNGAVVASNNI